MKAYLLLTLLSLAGNVLALPVFNLNVAPKGLNLVLWPDHEDPDLFYVIPQALKTVDEYSWGFKLNKDKLGVGFIAEFNEGLIADAKDHLNASHPERTINLIPVPLQHDSLNFGNILNDFSLGQDCRHDPGPNAAALFFCYFMLSPTGSGKLVPFFFKGHTLAFNASFLIKGMVQMANGRTKSYEMKIGLPVMMKKPL